ncbi:MAG: serine/threonine protein kinase [Gammaproteobacteria bacterium]|nr:serine/threonine protein kinase [Gammaproteobacteria bacterium]
MPEQQPQYADLTPDVILSAVETQGFQCSGAMLALNSYENRVYQLGMEEGPPLITKFYRPGRWRNEQILEEHQYSQELVEREIPVIAPLLNAQNKSLFEYQGYRFALFPRRSGQWPELDNAENLLWLGRFLGRIHAVGAIRRFEHRQRLNVQNMGYDSVAFLDEHGFLPDYLRQNYLTAATQLLDEISQIFESFGPYRILRLHGDCHPGNILWTENGPYFVDLDDCQSGPAIQDLWMLLSGDRQVQEWQLQQIIRGYNDFFEFDPYELSLVESLRTLRMIHYSAWLARRWDDSAFPLAFTWFNTPRYWEEQLNQLREQQDKLREPPLKLNL